MQLRGHVWLRVDLYGFRGTHAEAKSIPAERADVAGARHDPDTRGAAAATVLTPGLRVGASIPAGHVLGITCSSA